MSLLKSAASSRAYHWCLLCKSFEVNTALKWEEDFKGENSTYSTGRWVLLLGRGGTRIGAYMVDSTGLQTAVKGWSAACITACSFIGVGGFHWLGDCTFLAPVSFEPLSVHLHQRCPSNTEINILILLTSTEVSGAWLWSWLGKALCLREGRRGDACKEFFCMAQVPKTPLQLPTPTAKVPLHWQCWGNSLSCKHCLHCSSS